MKHWIAILFVLISTRVAIAADAGDNTPPPPNGCPDLLRGFAATSSDELALFEWIFRNGRLPSYESLDQSERVLADRFGLVDDHALFRRKLFDYRKGEWKTEFQKQLEQQLSDTELTLKYQTWRLWARWEALSNSLHRAQGAIEQGVDVDLAVPIGGPKPKKFKVAEHLHKIGQFDHLSAELRKELTLLESEIEGISKTLEDPLKALPDEAKGTALIAMKNDLDSAVVLFSADQFATSVYHAQQAAEKMMKALILLKGKIQKEHKTHNLEVLLQAVESIHQPASEEKRKELAKVLNGNDTRYRYYDPAVGLTKEGAEETLIRSIQFLRELSRIWNEVLK